MLWWTEWQAKSKDPDVRKRAAEKLGTASPGRETTERLPKSVALLLDLATDADTGVRAAAFESLGRVADGRAVEPVISAIRQIEALKEPAAAAVREAAARALQGIGNRAPSGVLAAARDKSPKVREVVVTALGGIAGGEAEQGLVAAVQDSRSNVRQAAVQSLARRESVAAVALLAPAVAHKDAATRRCAADVLAGIRTPQAVAALERLVHDADRGVRESAVRALGAQGSAEAIDRLLLVFEGGDRDLRELAARALRESDWQPASAGQRAFRAILRGEYRAAAAEGEAAVEPLSALLADKSPGTRKAATEALGVTAATAAVQPLLDSLRDNDSSVRQAAADALASLGVAAVAPLASAVHEDVRQASAEIIARIGAPAAGPLLEQLERGEVLARDEGEARQVTTEQDAECAARSAHLLTGLLGRAAAAFDSRGLTRVAHLRDIVRVREVMPANRRESPTTIVETVVDCAELRQRAAAEIKRRHA